MIYYFIFALATAIVCHISFMNKAIGILGAKRQYQILSKRTQHIIVFAVSFIFAPMFFFVYIMPGMSQRYLEKISEDD